MEIVPHEIVTHSDTWMVVATLIRHGQYPTAEWYRSREEAVTRMLAHSTALGVPRPAF